MENIKIEDLNFANIVAQLYDKTHDMRYELMLWGLDFSPETIDEKIISLRMTKTNNYQF